MRSHAAFPFSQTSFLQWMKGKDVGDFLAPDATTCRYVLKPLSWIQFRYVLRSTDQGNQGQVMRVRNLA